MIFTAKTKDLAELISRAAAGLPSRPSQDIYHRFRMTAGEDLRLLASDGDAVMLEARGECSTVTGGSCTVPGKLLADISKYFAADEVRAEHEGSELVITAGGAASGSAGRGRFSLPAGPGDDYPAWAQTPPAFLRCSGDELAAALRKVLPALGESPVVLSAVCMEPEGDTLHLVTTDHSRMAVASVPFTLMYPHVHEDDGTTEGCPGCFTDLPAVPALLPSADRLARALEGGTEIGWDKNILYARYPGGELALRLLQGEYLPWRNVLKKEPPYAGITSDTKELIRATRMAQLAAGQDNRISWTFTAHEIIVRAVREGRGCTEYVPCTYTGDSVTFLLGAQHVLDGLAGCGDTAEMTFTLPPAPLFLRSGSFKYSLQPRREL